MATCVKCGSTVPCSCQLRNGVCTVCIANPPKTDKNVKDTNADVNILDIGNVLDGQPVQ